MGDALYLDFEHLKLRWVGKRWTESDAANLER